MMEFEVDRSLALDLHALHEEDITWILDRIDAASRQQMLGLLNEIKALGFISERDLLQEIRGAKAKSVTSRSEIEDKTFSVVDSASADVVRCVLDREPQAVKRLVMGMQPWRWRHELESGPGARIYTQSFNDSCPIRKAPSAKVQCILQEILANAVSAADTFNSPGGSHGSGAAVSANRHHVRPRWAKLVRKMAPWLR